MTTISLYKHLHQIAAEKKMWLRVLGHVDGYPIWFIRNRESLRDWPRVLIVAGFHGEEQAGPLAILKWLEGFDPNLYKKVNLLFIPVVNPVGFNHNKRANAEGEKTNCGFCHPENGDRPSKEGIILIKNLSLLKTSSRNGFLSLHEDITRKKFYLYTFERTDTPGAFTHELKNELHSHFPEALDGGKVTADAQSDVAVEVKDGIVYRLCDGSCEDWLFHEGSNVAAATETPGKFPLKKRVEASVGIINRFIAHGSQNV